MQGRLNDSDAAFGHSFGVPGAGQVSIIIPKPSLSIASSLGRGVFPTNAQAPLENGTPPIHEPRVY